MTTIIQKTRGPCLICDGESIGVNFGVQTCMACKAFFRRNAVKLGVRYTFALEICLLIEKSLYFYFRVIILFVQKMVIVQ